MLAGHSSVSNIPAPIAPNQGDVDVSSVIVKADAGNASNVFVGPPTLTGPTNGYALAGGEETVPIEVESLDDVWVVGEVAGTNEKQTVAIDNAATEGSFVLRFKGIPTAAIVFDAEAAGVQAALEAILGAGNVEVTGGPGPAADWVVEFKGSMSGIDLPLLSGEGSFGEGVSGTVTVTETVKGAGLGYSWISM